jgi:hypothetical protein
MGQLRPSAWACARFGTTAAALLDTIPAALRRAHRRALASHVEMGFSTNEAYGLIWKALHEELVSAIGDHPGVRRTKPKGASYELVVIGEHNVILYPWRYGDDAHARVEDKRMRLSEVRNNLLALNPETPEPQLTLEHAELSDDDLTSLFEEEQRDSQSMASAARVVMLAYTSNPDAGLLRLFWGDAEKADDDGYLRWTHLEEIPLRAADDGTDTGSIGARPLTPVGPDTTAGRFDQAPLEEPLLGVRPPLTSPDTDPSATPQPETGSDA